MSGSPPYLLTPRQVHELSQSKTQLALLDASWYMPNSPRRPKDEFLGKRIPDAQFLDLDEVASEHELGLKHMMPSPGMFAKACEIFGINPSTHVILYDSQGVFSSPRALFMFRTFNHNNSSIIDGGLPRWEAEGLPLETRTPEGSRPAMTYAIPSQNDHSIRSYEQMVSNASRDMSSDLTELVVDARSHGRFTGKDPEPRPGLSSGHIPNSFSLPFNLFLESHTNPSSGDKYTTYLPEDGIQKALVSTIGSENASLVIGGRKSVTTTCGSGMTAAVLWLGLRLLGAKEVGLYDESWTGYASRKTSVIEKSL
ncbi:Rhodanese-like protein [Rickenella mellea]|uniref:Rhodanese-like protein n=1 Tax=Rickenella mellea TaxID=50990 RepID=A0A4Y7QPD6_9AGAM|nr:Rhodanese-like protein [Rickenella mellea]